MAKNSDVFNTQNILFNILNCSFWSINSCCCKFL